MEHSGAQESLWVYKSWGCLCVSGAGGDKWHVGRVQCGGRIALSLFPVADPRREGEKWAGDWRDKGEFILRYPSPKCVYTLREWSQWREKGADSGEPRHGTWGGDEPGAQVENKEQARSADTPVRSTAETRWGVGHPHQSDLIQQPHRLVRLGKTEPLSFS